MESLRSNYVFKVRRRGRVKWGLAYTDSDGRRCRVICAAPSREAARLLLAQAVRGVIEQKVSGVTAKPVITFADFCTKYLDHQKSAIEASSYERVRGIIDNSLKPALGKLYLTDVKPRDIQEYLNRRALTIYKRKDGTEKKVAPATVKRELITISGIFSRAVAWDYLDRSPVRNIRVRKYESRKMRILQLDEQERLYAAFKIDARRKHLIDIVTLALHSGMREGEMLGLAWGDVDLKAKRITVRSTNENPNKGKKTRAIGMSSKVKAMLSGLYMPALREARRLHEQIDGRYVFVNPRTGTRFVDTKTAWHGSLKDAEIKGVRFHDLRHTFATRAIQGGCKLPALQQILGHADITTTMRYVHMLGFDLDGVIESVETFEASQEAKDGNRDAASG